MLRRASAPVVRGESAFSVFSLLMAAADAASVSQTKRRKSSFSLSISFSQHVAAGATRIGTKCMKRIIIFRFFSTDGCSRSGAHRHKKKFSKIITDECSSRSALLPITMSKNVSFVST